MTLEGLLFLAPFSILAAVAAFIAIRALFRALRRRLRIRRELAAIRDAAPGDPDAAHRWDVRRP